MLLEKINYDSKLGICIYIVIICLNRSLSTCFILSFWLWLKTELVLVDY